MSEKKRKYRAEASAHRIRKRREETDLDHSERPKMNRHEEAASDEGARSKRKRCEEIESDKITLIEIKDFGDWYPVIGT